MFGIGLNNLIKIGFRVSDHILKQQEIERSRTASEKARLQAEASREKTIEENSRYRRTMLEDEIARASVAVECPNCGEKIYPFGASRLVELAEKYKIRLAASLPIDPKLAEACDKGRIEEFEGSWLDGIVDVIQNL